MTKKETRKAQARRAAIDAAYRAAPPKLHKVTRIYYDGVKTFALKGYEHSSGLLITRLIPSSRWDSWAITHAASGLRVMFAGHRFALARLLLWRVIPLADWTLSAQDVVKGGETLGPRIRALANDPYAELDASAVSSGGMA